MLKGYKIFLLIPGLLLALSVQAADGQDTTAEGLIKHYRELSQSGPGLAATLPLYLKTVQEDHVLNVSLIGQIPFALDQITEVLSKPESYCDFLPLMFNVKSCVITELKPVTRVKYYVAGKHYTPPVTSYRINSIFRLVEHSKDILRIRLEADEDSLGKSSYGVDLVAVPMDGNTLLYVESQYAPGRITRMATYTYVKVFARNKPGFTLIEEPGSGKKKLITGFPAIIERSTVRAYFALMAYMQNRHLPSAGRYESCLNTWYDLNRPYKKQLYELDRDQYLQIKRKERKNQLNMQQRVSQSAPVKVGVIKYSD